MYDGTPLTVKGFRKLIYVVEGNIYNWYNPNEYYVNSVVYGYSGGGYGGGGGGAW